MASGSTLLILGGSGYLGAHLLRVADRAWRAAAGFERVVAASRRPCAYRLPGTSGGIETRVFDGAVQPARALLGAVRPDLVVNALALSRVAACEAEPALAERLNAEVPSEVARWSAEHGTRFVHVSTDLVFGGRPARGERYAEDEAPAPLHVYGASKARGEERVLAGCAGALVLRLPLLYGDSCGRGLGASDALLAALARGESPQLFRDEWRTPLEAGNAAEALLEASLRDVRGILHVAGPERLSRVELGLRLLGALGWDAEQARGAVRSVARADLGMERSRSRDTSLDATRARALLHTPLSPPGSRSLSVGAASSTASAT